ncbi:hypothetical protein GCM10025868_36290 [Angustibacter aerolatus]|uniref:Uncharacterized protein n=1 Tax=Angustibacter aerolatus TaxID=1162965 RepID=A0ABQ6JKH5_9ACTN|nr:hypothetical protein GCM10025868_36290 [Angustibacter aerolatus]
MPCAVDTEVAGTPSPSSNRTLPPAGGVTVTDCEAGATSVVASGAAAGAAGLATVAAYEPDAVAPVPGTITKSTASAGPLKPSTGANEITPVVGFAVYVPWPGTVTVVTCWPFASTRRSVASPGLATVVCCDAVPVPLVLRSCAVGAKVSVATSFAADGSCSLPTIVTVAVCGTVSDGLSVPLKS